MKTIRLFDFIYFDGDSFQVIAQQGSTLALKSMTTNRIRHIAIMELLTDDSYESDSPDRLPALDNIAVLDTLDADTRDSTLWLYKHIYEIVHGAPPLANMEDVEVVVRPEYASEEPLMNRVAAKATELLSTGRPLSEHTIRRHVSAYQKHGIAALVDGRKRRRRQPGREQDPRLLALINEEIAAQENISTGTKSRVIARVTVQATDLGIPLPSSRTLYRIISAQARTTHAFGDATLRRTQSNRPDRTFGRRTPQRPGEIVEIDSTTLDLMVVFPDGTTGRPELTAMIDVATRTVSAAVFCGSNYLDRCGCSRARAFPDPTEATAGME